MLNQLFSVLGASCDIPSRIGLRTIMFSHAAQLLKRVLIGSGMTHFRLVHFPAISVLYWRMPS